MFDKAMFEHSFLCAAFCDAPFELVEGIGCIWLSREEADYDTAVTSCPAGSMIYSPPTLAIFTNLRNYFLGKKGKNLFRTYWKFVNYAIPWIATDMLIDM